MLHKRSNKMEEKKIWSMDDLVALTDEVQIDEVIFRG
jgi:hypothetical protein